jgi:hypothetical protein
MYLNRKYQPSQVVLIFHLAVPSLVLKTVSITSQVRRAFEAFVDPDQDLAQFVKLRIFPRYDVTPQNSEFWNVT